MRRVAPLAAIVIWLVAGCRQGEARRAPAAGAGSAAATARAPAPPAPDTSPAPSPPVRSREAEELVRQSKQAIRNTRTLQANLLATQDGTEGSQTITGELVFKRPNFAWITLKPGAAGLMIADGKQFFAYYPDRNVYRKRPAGPVGNGISGTPLDTTLILDPIDLFWHTGNFAPNVRGTSISLRSRTKVEGVETQVVEYTLPSQIGTTTIQYYIAKADRLPRRTIRVFKPAPGVYGEPNTTTTTLRNLRINKPVNQALFRWKPPEYASRIE